MPREPFAFGWVRSQRMLRNNGVTPAVAARVGRQYSLELRAPQTKQSRG